MDFLKLTFYNNTITTWIAAVAIFLATLIVINLIRKLVLIKIARLAKKIKTELDNLLTDIAKKTKPFVVVILAIFFGLKILTLPKIFTQIIQTIAILALLFQTAIWASLFLEFFVKYLFERKTEKNDAGAPMMSFLGFFGKFAIWSVALLLGLENVGVDVTALIAGLGIGSIAIALASQKILEDLFSSLLILFDKPFVQGDFIIVDQFLGTVEHIGLKTTRVRSLSGEQLVFSNTDLLQSRIRNYKRMFERRVVLNIGVIYQTPHEKLVLIPKLIKGAIESQEFARFDRAHFKEYGDFSLNFEAAYFIKSPDYNAYMDIQQAINLWIHKRNKGSSPLLTKDGS